MHAHFSYSSYYLAKVIEANDKNKNSILKQIQICNCVYNGIQFLH